MRILELGKYYPPSRGGMETALLQLCRGLRESGERVFVLVAAENRQGRAERLEGVPVRRLPSWGQLRSVPITPALPGALLRARREFRPDRVHLHLPNPGMTVSWWLFGDRSIPLVISYHSDIVRQRWLRFFLEPIRQRLLGRARRIVVSSQALLDESPSLAPHRDRCRVLPFGVPLPPLSSAEDSRDEQPYFLFVGRLVYYKGVEVLLEALLPGEHRLVVVGEGPRRAALEGLTRDLGLSSEVQFVGNCSDEQLEALYRGCRALVLPSVAASETFGLVQLEAMAHAKPVIAARASGGMVSVHRENETALLVPPGDAPALRAALVALWSDPQRAAAMGLAARRHVADHFDASDLRGAYRALLEEAAQ